MSNLVITVLTGGRSSRMNYQNKSFLKIYDKTIIEVLLDQLKILGYEIVINVNDDEEKYSKFGFKLVADKIKGRKGPLAGLHSVMSLYEKTKKNVWFASLEDIVDHLDHITTSGGYMPRQENLPYFDGPVLK